MDEFAARAGQVCWFYRDWRILLIVRV